MKCLALILFARVALAVAVEALLITSGSRVAQASDYLDPMPDSKACNVMKDDVDPNMESAENRDGMEGMFKDVMHEGKHGDSCSTLRSRRNQLENDSALSLTGFSKYAKERVFAWGKLCLLDWCDVDNSTSQPPPDPITNSDNVASSAPVPETSSHGCPSGEDRHTGGDCAPIGVANIKENSDFGDKSLSLSDYPAYPLPNVGSRQSNCDTDLEDLSASPTRGPIRYSCGFRVLASFNGSKIWKFTAIACRNGQLEDIARFKASGETDQMMMNMLGIAAAREGVEDLTRWRLRQVHNCVRLPDGPP